MAIRPDKLRHLSAEQHVEAAKLLRRIQDDLLQLSRIVNRAPFSDEILRRQKAIQERVINPLRDAQRELGPEQEGARDYPAVYYSRTSSGFALTSLPPRKKAL